MTVTAFLVKTYSGATLKAQAGTLKNYVEKLDVSDAEKKRMEASIPTGKGAVRSKEFQKAMAASLAKADRTFAAMVDKRVQSCTMRAELEVEARKRQVDISGVGTGLADLKKAIVGSSEGAKGARRPILKTPRPTPAKKGATPSSGLRRGARGKGAVVKFEAKAVTGSREDDDGTLEYEVWWEPCEENDYDDDERTWEKEGCSKVEGGMEALVTGYWEMMARTQKARGNKAKVAKGAKGAQKGAKQGAKREREGAKVTAKPKAEEDEDSEGGGMDQSDEEVVEVEEGSGDEGSDEGDEEGGSKRRKGSGDDELKQALTLLARVTARLTEGQVSMRQGQETMEKLWEQRAKSGEGVGSKVGGAKVLKNGESAGTLGMLKRWEDEGMTRFKKWVKEEDFYGAVEVTGYGEEGRRLNDLVERQKKAKRVMAKAAQRAADEPEDVRLKIAAEEREKHWIEVLEELKMAYSVVQVLKEGDHRGAKHMKDIFLEMRYESPEDRQSFRCLLNLIAQGFSAQLAHQL